MLGDGSASAWIRVKWATAKVSAGNDALPRSGVHLVARGKKAPLAV
jgi:hypothetical protein